MSSKILLKDTSPCCNTNAVVEETEDCVYFYLTDNPLGGKPVLRPCWVRNYGAAPLELDESGMKEGRSPMMPKEYCAHPDGAPRLEPSDLKIVWLEEGDGAALLYRNEILCVVPGWAGTQKYPGHARDCIKPYRLAVPLGKPDKKNILCLKVKLAEQFWSSWNEDVWKEYQSIFLSCIERDVCEHTTYYSLGSKKMPHKAMARLEADDVTYFITIGASVLPQPRIELYPEALLDSRRFELGLAIKTELLKENEDGILKFIGDLVSMPWYGYMWLGSGHTLQCPPVWPGRKDFSFTLLLRNAPGCPDIKLPSPGGDRINLLWIIPITESERKFAEKSGNEELLNNAPQIESIGVFDGKAKFISA